MTTMLFAATASAAGSAPATTEEAAELIASGQTSTATLSLLSSDKKALETLRALAGEREGNERARLWTAIARLDRPEARAAAKRALNGSDAYARAGAIRGLAHHAGSHELLYGRATSTDPLERDALFDAFDTMKAIDDPRLASLLDHPNEYAREISLRYLGFAGTPEQMDQRLLQALDDPSPMVQKQALILVAQRKRHELAVQAARLALSPDVTLAAQAMTTLSELEGKEVTRSLAAIVAHERASEMTWRRAAEILEERGEDEMLELGLSKAPGQRRDMYSELEQNQTPDIVIQ